jgi:hypothetical protein
LDMHEKKVENAIEYPWKCIALKWNFSSIKEVSVYVNSILYNNKCLSQEIIKRPKFLQAALVLPDEGSYDLIPWEFHRFITGQSDVYTSLRYERELNRYVCTVKTTSLKDLMFYTWEALKKIMWDADKPLTWMVEKEKNNRSLSF